MTFGTTPLSTTSLGSNQFPVSAVAVPGEAGGNLTALEGGPESTDSNGNKTSPVSSYVKDGGDVAQGLTTDAAVTGDSAGTLSAKLRGLNKLLGDVWDSVNHRIKMDGSGVTQPVSAVSLPLPTGASTSAKQPALGTAGSASTDVLTVQGITSMTALKVDGSGVTQPVSGTFWQATQPVSGTVTANAGTGTFTNQQSNITTDYDTGAGTQTMTMFGMALPASGGAVAGGTSSNPLRTDPTGVTTQPVSGTVSITANSAVNVAQVAGTTTDTNSGNKSAGTQRVVLATDQPQLTNALKIDGSAVTQPVSGTFWQATQPVSGTITANQGGTWTVQPGNTANTTAWLTSPQAASSGGSVPYHNISAATTNFTNVKGAACQMYGCDLSNTSASTIFVKFYDKATAPATTDVPKRTIQVPANATVIRAFPVGVKFANGFGWAATGAVADNDNTAIAANCVVDFDLNS